MSIALDSTLKVSTFIIRAFINNSIKKGEAYMKKLVFVFLSLVILVFSNFAFASVHGTWSVGSNQKTTLTIGNLQLAPRVENVADVWFFKDDNSFSSAHFLGTWSQKGASFTVTVDPEQVRALLESELLSNGLPATATIKKIRIFGSEKKNQTIKGKYEVKADLVFPDLSTGKLNIISSFTGTLPYDTAEYFPLNLGDSRTTEEIQTEITAEGEETYENIDTITVFGTEKIKGVIAMQRGDTEEGYYDLMTNTNGVKIYKMYAADFEDDVLVFEILETFNPPLMYLPPRLSVGTRGTFKSTMTVTAKGGSGFKATAKVTVGMVVVGMEDVTVTAGSFQDCLRVKITRHLVAPKVKYEESSETTIWLAKGVGMVKEMGSDVEITEGEVEESSYTDELISATVGGVNYP
jgi:hypothetical protein